MVLTAAHCAWDQASGNFVQNWAFVPDFDSNPNGARWYASALIVRNEFATQANFNSVALANDWAFAVVLPGGGNGSTLPDQSGANAYSYSETGFVKGYASYAFGYPAAQPFNGLTLKYAGATIFVDPATSSTWGMNSSMTGGASGGPWLSNGLSKDGSIFGQYGSLSSLNSYKYTKDSTKMYGPIFNSRTTATLATALNSASNTHVS